MVITKYHCCYFGRSNSLLHRKHTHAYISHSFFICFAFSLCLHLVLSFLFSGCPFPTSFAHALLPLCPCFSYFQSLFTFSFSVILEYSCFYYDHTGFFFPRRSCCACLGHLHPYLFLFFFQAWPRSSCSINIANATVPPFLLALSYFTRLLPGYFRLPWPRLTAACLESSSILSSSVEFIFHFSFSLEYVCINF